MGCFGTSGFLSRLPILSGQRVTSYLIGRELENGTVEYQKNSLGGFTFSPYIDGDTCRWKTKDEASDEIDRYKELNGCLLWQLDEIKVVKPIDY